MRTFTLVGLLTVFLLPAGLRADDDEEVIVKLTDCPRAVQKTLKREARGGTIEEIEKWKDDEGTFFEADVIIDGREYEIIINEDGILIAKFLEEYKDEDDEDDEDQDEDEDDDEDEEEDDEHDIF